MAKQQSPKRPIFGAGWDTNQTPGNIRKTKVKVGPPIPGIQNDGELMSSLEKIGGATFSLGDLHRVLTNAGYGAGGASGGAGGGYGSGGASGGGSGDVSIKNVFPKKKKKYMSGGARGGASGKAYNNPNKKAMNAALKKRRRK